MDGALQWDSTGVPISTAAGRQEFPAIASDGDSGAIITWMDNRNYSTEIYGQRVNSQGIVQWTINGIPVSNGSGQAFPAMISDGSGGTVITWSNSTNSDYYSVYAQKINSNGQTLWTQPGILVSTVPQALGQQFIASDDSGGAIIGFQSFGINSNVNDTSIYAQRIKADGSTQWTSKGIRICSDSASQSFPAITSDGNGGAIITWSDDRNDYGDIFAQKISSNGAIKWPLIGEAVCTASELQEFPAIVSNGSGGAIITWEDSRNNNSNSDIYAQAINTAAVLSVESTSLSAPTKFTLEQNYPNPFNPSTMIEYQIPKSEFVSLKIYDVLGREVTTLVNKQESPGKYSVEFNADELPNKLTSGVYFYTLRAGSFVKTKKLILMK